MQYKMQSINFLVNWIENELKYIKDVAVILL